MTFSIVARSGAAHGVAVASKFLAVGSVVPAVDARGAVATQAWARTAYKQELLELLAKGVETSTALDQATSADEGREARQVGVVGPSGPATFTGADATPWCGGRTGEDGADAYAIQGNILVGEEVVLEMEQQWLRGAHLPFADRLAQVLLAGDRAGGDRRGRQSAALLAYSPGTGYDDSGVLADLRVDDHDDPVPELIRLLDLQDLYLGRPTTVLRLQGNLAEEVAARLQATGRRTEDVSAALADWAGVENLEMRLTDDGIDARVLQVLRERTGELPT
ncbi:DUF1028 domain-containing protein [Luteipulveratus mongoliensis]|uniref:Major pilin protein FimA n=1 Tax=Luteipulveratus mongoliensis TaxID=571913 RepID=A0A0K1JKA7_9MICO|nr:DUF1028 domain-containing protein [Luteipulveratus mongoliensis]AKU17136.1 major pilin protein FimA [Luteipulveratus mongoliensis]